MKQASFFLMALLFFFAAARAQDQNWTRVEFEPRLEMSLPEGFLIDKEPDENKRIIRLVYDQGDLYLNIVVSELKEYSLLLAKESIGFGNSDSLEIDSLFLKKFSASDYEQTILIVSKKFSYSIYVRTSENSRELGRKSMASIKVKGKDPFKQEGSSPEPKSRLSVSEMASSAEVVEAYRRTSGRQEGSYEKMATEKELLENLKLSRGFSRNVISLYWPGAKTFYKTIRKKSKDQKSIRFSAVLEYLADGRVGKVLIYSNLDEKTNRIIAGAMRSVVFVPARSAGGLADQKRLFLYNINVAKKGEIRNL